MLDAADHRDTARAMPQRRVLSPEGLEHIQLYEGFRARTYDDLQPDVELTAAHNIKGTLTIGYGHTGREAWVGNEISKAEAEALVISELREFEVDVQLAVTVPLTQGEYDALVSFVYNVGAANFGRSTLLRKLNARDYDGAAMEFSRWIYSKGRRLRGLKLRRMAEAAMFEGQRAFGLSRGDLTIMANEAERLLMVGAGVRPDALDERGLMKPLSTSKTIIGSVLGSLPLGGLGIALTTFEQLDWRVQLAALGVAICAFLFLIINRTREHRAGQH